MECRLSSSSGPWKCQVLIRWEFDKSGKPLSKISEVPFGSHDIRHEDVELVLRRAQTAVLYPAYDASYFSDMTSERLSSFVNDNSDALRFSRNVVCIDLEGPDLTDLSFIDLPGQFLKDL